MEKSINTLGKKSAPSARASFARWHDQSQLYEQSAESPNNPAPFARSTDSIRNRQGIRGETISRRSGQPYKGKLSKLNVLSKQLASKKLDPSCWNSLLAFTVPDDRLRSSRFESCQRSNSECIRQWKDRRKRLVLFHAITLYGNVDADTAVESWHGARSRSVRSRSRIMCVSTARSTWTIHDIKSTYKNQLPIDFVMDTLNLFQLLARSAALRSIVSVGDCIASNFPFLKLIRIKIYLSVTEIKLTRNWVN